jgi:hypothetical protein
VRAGFLFSRTPLINKTSSLNGWLISYNEFVRLLCNLRSVGARFGNFEGMKAAAGKTAA